MWQVHPWLAIGVFVSTAVTDAVYVMFTASVTAHRRVPAASWSSLWYLLSAFAVITYTKNWSTFASRPPDPGLAHICR